MIIIKPTHVRIGPHPIFKVIKVPAKIVTTVAAHAANGLFGNWMQKKL